MKQIFLLRHAKSSHADASLKDFKRPLDDRGEKDASYMGAFAKKAGCRPDLIISSPAKRASETTRLFCRTAGMDMAQVGWNDELYYGNDEDYLEAVNGCEAGDTLMLVGHNPSIESAAARLCSTGNSYVVRMRTSALLCLEYPAIAWEQVKPGTARIKWMVVPGLIEKLIG